MVEHSPFESISRAMSRRQIWPPFLIIVGSQGLFLIPFRDPSKVSTVHYVAMAVGFVMVIAGIALMFYWLRAESVALEPSSVAESATEPELAVVQLGKNYEILRRQTTQGFIMAGTFMALGFVVILSGSAGVLFGFATGGSHLTTVAGVVMEFISGTSLLVYRLNFKRLNDTTDRLDASWRVLTAHRLAATLPDDKRSEATLKLIEALIARGAA